jgi:hypothetical protein
VIPPLNSAVLHEAIPGSRLVEIEDFLAQSQQF